MVKRQLAVLVVAVLVFHVSGITRSVSADSIGAISIIELGLLSTTREELAQVEVGQQTAIRVSIQKNVDYDQPFVLLLEVRDGYGITRMLAWQNGTIATEDAYSIEISWVPTDDCFLDNDECTKDYQIRSFAISSFDNPQVLSVVRTLMP